eukprot:COSAG01_NODE_10775_length_2082_cov_15.495714_2_plen_60_part_00
MISDMSLTLHAFALLERNLLIHLLGLASRCGQSQFLSLLSIFFLKFQKLCVWWHGPQAW